MQYKFIATVSVTLIFIAVLFPVSENYSGTTIHLAGDSTMSVQLASKRPATGWGEPFASMLCHDVRVINHAKNGRSTKSFISEGLWKDLLAQVRAGDVVVIQFGHNDQKIFHHNLHTSPWQDYRENLQRFVIDSRTLGAEPVLLTSIVRRAFNSQGALEQTLGDYPEATRKVAVAMDVKLIDLNASTHELIAAMGPSASKQWYLHLAPGTENYSEGTQDDTHLNSQGALEVATLVATDLKKMLPDLVCI